MNQYQVSLCYTDNLIMGEAEEWNVQHVVWTLQPTEPKHARGDKKVLYIRTV